MSKFSMMELHRTALRKNRSLIVKDLILNEDFYSLIMENKIITEDMRESIMSLRNDTKKAKNAAFLDILPRRGPTAFEEFIRSCVFSDQSYLALALDSNLAAGYITKYEKEVNEQSHQQHPPPMSRPPAKQEKPNARPTGFVSPQINQTATPVKTDNMTEVPKEMVDSPIMTMPMRTINPDDPKIQREQLNEKVSYKMSLAKRGRVLIINNEYFLDPKLSTRDGSQYDAINICELFKNLHFDTNLKDNVTAKGMRKLLLEESKMQFNSEAFILFIMSHGSHGRVYGNDGKSLDIESEIVPMFDGNNCPDLLNKPKMFFIQACQGEMKSAGLSDDNTDAARGDTQEMNLPAAMLETSTEEVTEAMKHLAIVDSEDSTPSFDRTTHERADMVLAYSTIPGYLAWRNSAFGSWFVRSIVYVFSNHAHECHLMDLLLYVRQMMTQMRTADLERPFMQITTTSDRLLKKLYFCPGYTVSNV